MGKSKPLLQNQAFKGEEMMEDAWPVSLGETMENVW